MEIEFEMPREFSRSVHEHEVFISFNCDDMAYAFHEWWKYKKGAEIFDKFYVEWLEKQNERYR